MFMVLKFSSVPIKSVNILLKYVAPIVTPSDQKNCSNPISQPKLSSGLSESFPKKGSYNQKIDGALNPVPIVAFIFVPVV